MAEEPTAPFKLCPNCANSVDENAEQCPYCKADLVLGMAPKWLNRTEASSESRGISNNKKKFPIPEKFIWTFSLIVGVVIAFFAGGYRQRSELAELSKANSKQLQAKDQMIQSQQEQLAQIQKQLNDNSNQVADLKTKLQETQKELSVKQQRLAAASREAKNLNATRSATVRRTATHGSDASPSYPQPARVSRTAEPGVYETTKTTSVHETPSSSSRAISQIGRGTRINVVNGAGDWLEVRSRHGNPPGYVRADDARLIARAN